MSEAFSEMFPTNTVVVGPLFSSASFVRAGTSFLGAATLLTTGIEVCTRTWTNKTYEFAVILVISLLNESIHYTVLWTTDTTRGLKIISTFNITSNNVEVAVFCVIPHYRNIKDVIMST